MLRNITCIVCPNGCEIETNIENGKVISMEGALCKRGDTYVNQEVVDPKRNIATSVKVIGGDIPLVSVRITDVVPKKEIFSVMDDIKKIEVFAPVKIGQVLIEDVLDLGVDVIATKSVASL